MNYDLREKKPRDCEPDNERTVKWFFFYSSLFSMINAGPNNALEKRKIPNMSLLMNIYRSLTISRWLI